jgi:hypothetical protein
MAERIPQQTVTNDMTHQHLIWKCLLALVYLWAVEYCAGGDSGVTPWQPDPYIINESNVIWGVETNHVKAGLSIQYSSDLTNRTLVGFVVVLYWDSSTNGNSKGDFLSLLLPPINTRYNLSLLDDKGMAVAKTEIGKTFAQVFDANPKTFDVDNGYVAVGMFPSRIDVLPSDRVVLENMFAITNAGQYHLNLVLNTFKWTDDKGNRPFFLPVQADIEITHP